MRECILHAGLPKTGTTSIQSSLFRNLRDARFRLVSLDCFHGNRMVVAAFGDRFGSERMFFSEGVTPRMAARTPIRARSYLDRSLRAAADRGVTPIVSAEMISVLKEGPLARLRDFLVDRGWVPRVIVYARAPLDFTESAYQQKFRIGTPQARLSAHRTRIDTVDYHVPFARLDRIFGAEAVTVRWFDPAAFPGRCVVRDFCATTGIAFRDEDVLRENESVNLAAVRFLHALILAGHGRGAKALGQTHWRVLLDRFADLPGPPLRLHASITRSYLEKARAGWPALEERLGRPLPFTLYARDPDGGIRSEEDLLDFSPESLEWLAAATGQRVVRRGEGETTLRGVVAQLRAITPFREPGVTCRALTAVAGDALLRKWRAFRNTR